MANLTLTEALNRAVQYHQGGNFSAAEQLYGAILQAVPNHSDALHLLGVIYCQTGRKDQAVPLIAAAVAQQPTNPVYQLNLGLAYQESGRLSEAETHYRHAIVCKPDFAEPHRNLGAVLDEQGRYAEAEASYRQALAIQPNSAETYNGLGIVHKHQDRLPDAVAAFQHSIRLNPNLADPHNNLGNAQCALQQWDEARASFEQALRLRPGFAAPLTGLASVAQGQGKLDEALERLDEILQREPNLVGAITLKAEALRGRGRLEEAAACLQQALRIKPDHASAHRLLGTMARYRNDIDEAIGHFERALNIQPSNAGLHLAISMPRLLIGDFERGWEEYEYRWKCPGFHRQPFAQPRWDGGRLDGKTILLHAEQGLGDTLQFIRYAGVAKEAGGRVVVEAQDLLVGLMARCPGVDQVVGKSGELPAFDVHCPLMSLPFTLKTTLATIPANVPYLFPEEDRVEYWRSEIGKQGYKIGLCWKGNPDNQDDRQRSVPLSRYLPLAEIPGVRLFSLQVGAGSEELTGNPPEVTDLSSRLSKDFLDSAAAVKCMDLVLTVDTAMAHLAGGLGVQTWLALPFACDWRWLLGRDDSPWYPTMRLFRQQAVDDWDPVFARIEEEVKLLCRNGERGP